MRKAATVGRIARAARWIVVPLATLLGVARLLVTGACVVTEEPPPASRGCLFRDPTLHRVVVHGCETSLDCPEGTACSSSASARDGDRWAECTDPDGGERSCRAITLSYVRTSALTQGFGVREMKLTRSAESSVPVYSWTAPEEAVTVVCALFGSPPLFQPSATRKDATGKPVVEMGNFGEAVLAWRAFSGDRSSTTVEELVGATAGSVPSDIDPGVASSVPASSVSGSSAFVLGCGLLVPGPRYRPECPRPTTSLTFGCWAYGATEIVAASLTTPVEPIEQASQGWVLGEGECAIPTNDGPSDGRACVLPLPEGAPDYFSFFGTCRDGQCVLRCARDADCCPSFVRTSGSGSGGSGGLTTSSGGGAGGSATGGVGGTGGATSTGVGGMGGATSTGVGGMGGATSTGVGGMGGATSTGVGGMGGATSTGVGGAGGATSTGVGGACPDVCLCPKLGGASPYGRPFVGQCGAPADGDLIDSEACTFSGFTTVSGGATGGTSP